MNNYFDITEFIIDPDAEVIPIHVVHKIDKYHKPILNGIRHELHIPIYISKHSGYRSFKWEIEHGRSGDSQHTFGDGHEDPSDWWGAVDLACEDMEKLLGKLKKSKYNRVCYYPEDNFAHCDFKGDRYLYFEADSNGKWEYKGRRNVD